jgi:hypothetical protein
MARVFYIAKSYGYFQSSMLRPAELKTPYRTTDIAHTIKLRAIATWPYLTFRVYCKVGVPR